MPKRYAELEKIQRDNKQQAEGRGYFVADLAIMPSLGTASGNGAILVFALYMIHPDVMSHYQHRRYLRVIFGLLLFWMSNMWFVALRGRMHYDLTVFTAKNKISIIVVALCVLTVLVAS